MMGYEAGSLPLVVVLPSAPSAAAAVALSVLEEAADTHGPHRSCPGSHHRARDGDVTRGSIVSVEDVCVRKAGILQQLDHGWGEERRAILVERVAHVGIPGPHTLMQSLIWGARVLARVPERHELGNSLKCHISRGHQRAVSGKSITLYQAIDDRFEGEWMIGE